MAEMGGQHGSMGEGASPLPEPILTQAEIDALTAFSETEAGLDTGIRAVAESGAVVPEPMPMLDIVFERFVRQGSASLREYLRGDGKLRLERLNTLRLSEYAEAVVLPARLFRFAATGWGGEGLLTIGSQTAYLILEKLLGGGRGEQRPRPTKPPTAIETSILTQLVTFLLREAERSFSEVAPVKFELIGSETNPQAVLTSGAGQAVLVATLSLEIDGSLGEVELVLPAATLEPVKPLLAGRFNGEKLGRDGLWSAHLATEIWQADIQADAVLHELQLPLGRVLDLAVGDTLMLGIKPSDLVTLRCGRQTLTRGRIGRVDGRIAIQVAEPLRPGRQADGATGSSAG